MLGCHQETILRGGGGGGKKREGRGEGRGGNKEKTLSKKKKNFEAFLNILGMWLKRS